MTLLQPPPAVPSAQPHATLLNGPSAAQFAAKLLEVEHAYLGVSRTSDKAQVSRFLELFGLPFAEGGKPLSFCAAGLGFCACKAYGELMGKPVDSVDALKAFLHDVHAHYFLPHPQCHVIMQDAQARGRWVAKADLGSRIIKPGNLVMYSWKKGSRLPEHIETVVSMSGQQLHTIGFNTSGKNAANGGAVEEKDRTLKPVVGFIVYNP